MGKESPFPPGSAVVDTRVPVQILPDSEDETRRSRKKVKGKRTSGKSNAAGGRWSIEEDERLRQGVTTSGPKNWKHISELWMGGKRTDVQCLHRWNKVLKPGLVKGPWTTKEDDILRTCIEGGITTWSDIAEHVHGRIGKQCRERWQNHLHPLVKKGNWEPYEDKAISVHRQQGHKWCDIARLLPGRTESGVKNRWNSICRRTSKADEPHEPNPKRFKKQEALPTTPRPSDPIAPEFAVLRNVPRNDKHEQILSKLLDQLPLQFLKLCASQKGRKEQPISPMAGTSSTLAAEGSNTLAENNKQRMEVWGDTCLTPKKMEVWEETCLAILGDGVLPVKQEPVDGEEASRVFSGPPAFG
jgi:hypothetical protein